MANAVTNQQEHLYEAQKAGIDAMKDHWFPRYNKSYLQAQKGLWKAPILIYSCTCNVISVTGEYASYLVNGLIKNISLIANGFFAFEESYIGLGETRLVNWYSNAIHNPITNVLCPLNKVNGTHHFVGVPRSVEKFLGDYIFYPLSSGGMSETNAKFEGTDEVIADSLETIVGRINQANQELLQCELDGQENEEGTKFNYRVKTIQSDKINAFACPGGGMVVFKGIANEIANSFDRIEQYKIKQTKIQLADGTTVTLNLEGVTKEDVLAALLGHEMTHVASRHSMVALIASLVRSVVLNVGRVMFISYLKISDKEYQKLIKKRTDFANGVVDLNQQQALNLQDAINSKEQFFIKLNDLLTWVEDKVKDYSGLLCSRNNEYEADITGAYFAQKARYNPLGALYLQELLSRNSKNSYQDFFHRNFEFFFTHPYSENRKRSLFAGLQKFEGDVFEGRIVATDTGKKFNHYDLNYLSPAAKFAHEYVNRVP